MVVLVITTVIGLIMGSGLMVLGAFFLWRMSGKLGAGWGLVILLVPVAIMIVMASACGLYEMTVGLIWGTITLNFGLVACLCWCWKLKLNWSTSWSPILWLSLGWGMCQLAGYRTTLGYFGGLGLIIVGLIAFSQMNLPKQNTTMHSTKIKLNWWYQISIIVALCVVGLGAWLVVQQQTLVATFCSLPVSVCGMILLAPVGVACALGSVRCFKQLQISNLLQCLLWANALLATLALGAITVGQGGLHLPQSMLSVTLPWVAGMVLLLVVGHCLPQKTARWWSGWMIVLYLGYVISLFV